MFWHTIPWSQSRPFLYSWIKLAAYVFLAIIKIKRNINRRASHTLWMHFLCADLTNFFRSFIIFIVLFELHTASNCNSNYKPLENQPISWLAIVNRCQNNSIFIFIAIIPLCWHWMRRHEQKNRKTTNQQYFDVFEIFLWLLAAVYLPSTCFTIPDFMYSKFRVQAYNERIENGLNRKQPSLIVAVFGSS